MVTTTATYTPWGWTRDIVGARRRHPGESGRPSHGGLKLSRERWNELPAAVRDSMLYENLRRGGLRGADSQDAPGRRRRQRS